MKSYEVTIKLTKTFYQLVTVEDCASEDDVTIEAYEMIDDYNWEFSDDDCEIIDIDELS